MPPAVFTTTVFAGGAPTDAPSSSGSAPRLPIGAIVGGLVGGVALAMILVFGWIWWGRSLERAARKERPLRSAMKTSATASRQSLPRTPRTLTGTRNPMANVSQKSVTFAPSPRTSDDESERKGAAALPGAASRTSLDRHSPDARTSLERARSAARVSPDARGASRTSLDRPTPESRTSLERRPGASSTSLAPDPRQSSRTSLDRPAPDPRQSSRTSLDRRPGASSTSLAADPRQASRTSLDRRPGASATSLPADPPRTAPDPDSRNVSRTSLDRPKPGASSASLDHLDHAFPVPEPPTPPATPPRSALRPPALAHTTRPARPSPLADAQRRDRAAHPPPVTRALQVPAPLPPGASPPVPQPTVPPLPAPPTGPRRLTRPPPAAARPPPVAARHSTAASSVSMYSQSTASEGAEALLRAGGAPTVTRMP